MTIASTILSIALIACFGSLGGAKLVLAPSVVEHVTALGFSMRACRIIGGLEIAACLGLIVGFFWEPVSLVASLGLFTLMIGALRAQLWAGTDFRTALPAVWLGAIALAATVITAVNLAL